MYSSCKVFMRALYISTALLVCAFTGRAWGEYSYIYRDLPTGIYSSETDMVSLRYMRHIWIGSDGAMAAVAQQGGYDGNGLVLFRTVDNGVNWTPEVNVSGDTRIASDGIIDLNNDVLLVTSIIGDDVVANVNFVRLSYDPVARTWRKALQAQKTIFKSGSQQRASRATIAQDANGVLWCAFRINTVSTGIYRLKVYYSLDGGATWKDSGKTFGTSNNLSTKSVKIIAVDSRIAIIFSDARLNGTLEERFKAWAYRDDSAPYNGPWTVKYFAKMGNLDGDPLASHWSVAVDYLGNIHLSYEDGAIMYERYNAATGNWDAPRKMTNVDWHYSNISVAPNNDIYLIARNSDGTKIMATTYSSTGLVWSDWSAISLQSYNGYLRMSCPERFNDYLPVLYQINQFAPFELLYDLFR